MTLPSRNDPIGFAQRTIRNLKYIESGRASGKSVHVVSQYVLSLLGLIVFPQEAYKEKPLMKRQLTTLVQDGWPDWKQTFGEVNTLGKLLRHVRNGTAHRKIRFSGESLNPADVTIYFEDAEKNEATNWKWKTNWKAEINAADLKRFCLEFAKALGCVEE